MGVNSRLQSCMRLTFRQEMAGWGLGPGCPIGAPICSTKLATWCVHHTTGGSAVHNAAGPAASQLQLPATVLPVVTAHNHAQHCCGDAGRAVLQPSQHPPAGSTAWWHPSFHLNTTGDGLATAIKEAGCCSHIPAVGGTTPLKTLPMQGQYGSTWSTYMGIRPGDARLTK
jgi:hypothetical protein